MGLAPGLRAHSCPHFHPKNLSKTPQIAGKTGISGVAYGLTIPGPPNSYMSARVDVSCFLPHGPTTDDAVETFGKAAAIVQKQLETHAAEIVEFFKNY